MAKSVEDIVRSQKLKAHPKLNLLSVRVGNKKHALPFEVRVLSSDDYLFVHIPPCAGLLKLGGKSAVPVSTLSDAQAAVISFRQANKRQTRKSKRIEMPAELENALRRIPSGYKLSYAADGKPRLVKKRTRITKPVGATAPARARKAKRAKK